MSPEDAQHYAESWAMLAGDYCAVLASDLLLTARFPAAIRLRLQMLQQAVLKAVIAGQLADVSQSFAEARPSEAEVLRMYHDKTASYSFSLPAMSAALMAGVAPVERGVLSKLGAALGLAYQLRDDVLGVYGDEAVTGKRIGTDIREGRTTVLVARALQTATGRDQKRLLSIIGNSQATDDDIAYIANYFETCGALHATEELIAKYTLKAQELIAKTSLSKEVQGMLFVLTGSLIDRQS